MSQLFLPFFGGPKPIAQPAAEPLVVRDGGAAPEGRAQGPGPERSERTGLLPPVRPSAPRLLQEPAPAPKTPRTDLFLTAASALAERIGRHLEEAVEVELTDNAWTMVSYKRLGSTVRFRLHHMFCDSDEAVVRARAGFTGRARKHHGRVIDQYIKTHRVLIRSAPARAEGALQTRGRVYDLAEIYQALNARHFNGTVDARICWGRSAPVRRRRSIKMGVYLHEQKLIRLHPALDDARVPRHFVELVVFHEMLHQVVPPTEGDSGRRCVHGPAFREAERRFPGYEKARAWEKANLGLLLRSKP
jgi:hypothetical protein